VVTIMELSLVAIETDAKVASAESGAGPAAAESAGIEPSLPPVDPFLAEATREYEGGHVERPLWAHAAALGDGDAAATLAAYLRARATALRLAGREHRVPPSGGRSRPARPPRVDADVPEASAPEPRASPRPSAAPPAWRRWWPAPVALVVAGVAAWAFFAPGADVPVPPPVAGAVGTAAAMASPPGGAGLQAPVAAAVSPAAALAAQRAEREAKVQELIGAGNWNVLVLHAAEWTRKDPTYADAWKYLAVGYANMRQHEDAFLAGEKAAQLAPADRELWRNLGRLGIAAGRPEGALHAYEQALAIDGQDAASLVQAGRLQAELGLLPQARATFDRALVASPADPDALCGQAQVAQRQGRGKDAEAIVRDLRRGAKECSLAEAVPATVAQAAAPASGSKPVPQRGR
jgi:tetratricopeptide (TPR) repeat protein